ncbi:variable surface protein [Plasmodium gonderi]|uniref:Variable surface protein n=1 Tax=Plasmodium gonderi TaxID=77519 RepID=A0A1Y1JNU3_PLAGO|nr:variable surface protein [Plasmodium gonderi]GAW84139.1 variable surface protein [Plasmodium gonderi]
MNNDNFKIVKEFPKFEEIMNNSQTECNSWNADNFSHITDENYPHFKNYVQSICEKFDKYTCTIQHHRGTSVTYNSSCKYLYYWLYHYNNNEWNIDEVKKLYDALISADSTSHQHLCKTYNVTTITEDVMPKLKDLHDMYTNLNILEKNSSSQYEDKCKCAKDCAELYMKYKNSCESNNYFDLCNELIYVREKYNELSTTKCYDQLTYKTLPLFKKNNITVPILITIFLILIISITLFNLHKFTPYNSCFQGTLRRKRNKWNNIDNDYNIFQSYKNVSSAALKSRHHILYHIF